MGWACFQTYGSQEKKAVENLVRQGLDAFSPFYVKPGLPAPKSKLKGPKELPLFPCYGFVRLDDPLQWGKPNNTYGVIRLLTDRNRIHPRPLWVPDVYIDSISGLRDKTSLRLPVNTLVRVKNRGSPFFDLVGTIVSMTKSDKIKLLMNLFNRDIIVEFETAADLEVVEKC